MARILRQPGAQEALHGCCAPTRPTELPKTGAGDIAGNVERRDAVAAPESVVPDMVDIAGGAFSMGSDSAAAFPGDGEGPVRPVQLAAYRIGTHTVTNREYAAFDEATGHASDAQRSGWSYVFADHVHPDARGAVVAGSPSGTPWWRAVRGATWAAPAGPGSSVDQILDHPVVHVSHQDAVAYTHWCGTRLPTEAEWEGAARGGLDQATYPWGNELTPGGQHRCNIWQGRFPARNTGDDGYQRTAPAVSFPPNGYGLYNCAGNVWEWTADWFSPDWHVPATPTTRTNPAGPGAGAGRVVKGGSFLCHASYCNRYRPAARTHNTSDTSLSHTGFRVAADL